MLICRFQVFHESKGGMKLGSFPSLCIQDHNGAISLYRGEIAQPDDGEHRIRQIGDSEDTLWQILVSDPLNVVLGCLEDLCPAYVVLLCVFQ